MPAFLTSIGAKLAVAGVILAILVGGWLYIGKLQAEAATANLAASQAQGVAKSDAATIVSMQADQRRYDAMETQLIDGGEARAASANAARAAIDATATAPIAPSSAQTLDLLRSVP